jgi:hypothetical protein
MAYFASLSAFRATERRMVGSLVNDELERIWKEAVVT